MAARRDGRAGPHDDLPPFLGVPCPVKDLTMVEGVPMRAGSAAIDLFLPPSDDGVVTLLRRAGTVMVGKTSTPELGLPCYTEPDVGPTARTPWTSHGQRAGRAGARPPRSRRASCPSRTGATAAARCASPRARAGSSGSSRRAGS